MVQKYGKTTPHCLLRNCKLSPSLRCTDPPPPPKKKRIKQIRINIAPVKRVKLLLRSGYTRYYHLTFLGPPYRLLLVRSKENFKYEVNDNNQEEIQNTKLRYFLNFQQRFALLSLFLVYPNPTPTCHRERTNCFEINR